MCRTHAFKYGPALLCSILFFVFQYPVRPALSDTPAHSLSKAAAERCRLKLREIEDFAAREGSGGEQTTRFTEEEVNSYIMLDATLKYKSCVKDLKLEFLSDFLEGAASVDFDCLKESPSKSLPKLITSLFSGTHIITARGTLASKDGKGIFQLQDARFDNDTLPRFLVEEAITLVCKNQKPPFDPMQTSTLPFNIQRVTVHPGYIMVYQQRMEVETGTKQKEAL